jgi:hypothetical protein
MKSLLTYICSTSMTRELRGVSVLGLFQHVLSVRSESIGCVYRRKAFIRLSELSVQHYRAKTKICCRPNEANLHWMCRYGLQPLILLISLDLPGLCCRPHHPEFSSDPPVNDQYAAPLPMITSSTSASPATINLTIPYWPGLLDGRSICRCLHRSPCRG